MNKKMAAAGLTAGLVAGIGAGAVLESSGSAGASSWAVQATDDTTDTSDTTDTTDTSDSTESADHPDFATHLQEILQPLIDDGTLTQAQVDAVIETLEAARPADGPFGGPGGHHGRGPGPALAVVAETIGITEDEVRAGLQSGQTLAEIAVANGSSAQAVIDAILADISTRVAEQVAAGDITQAEADEHLAEATARVTDMVNNGVPGRPGDGDADTGTADSGS